MPSFYTVTEANALLPELTALLHDLQEHGNRLAEVQAQLMVVNRKLKGNGHVQPSNVADLAAKEKPLEESFKAGLEKLARLSIELKDLQRGLIDFPAIREGRIVCLCWELGEPEVAFWHELDTGFAGRQPLDDKIA